MPSYEDDLPALFRSLRPDQSALLNETAISAKEAEQKWPLLRNISVKNRDLPPALSNEERLNWAVSETTANMSATRPTLSHPGLGEKIASGLGKMTAKAVGVAPQPAAQDAAPAREAPIQAHAAQLPFGTAHQPSPAKHHESTQPVPTTTSNRAVATDSASCQPQAAPLRAAGPAHAEESLAQIFNRLEGKAKPVTSRPTKSPSFLGRLGKR